MPSLPLHAVRNKANDYLIDRELQATMFALRNPLADRLMADLAAIGSAPVLGTASVAALLWLGWRRRWMAAAHWLAAIAVGLLLTVGLDALVDTPRPPTAAAGLPTVPFGPAEGPRA